MGKKVELKEYIWKCADVKGNATERGIIGASFDVAYQSILATADYYGWTVLEYLGWKEVDKRLIKRNYVR